MKKVLLRIGRGVLVLVISMLLLFFYEMAARIVLPWVFWVYFSLLAGATLAVVIYNRGFSPFFYKREELPASWSEAQRDEFFAAARRRLSQTAPVIRYLLLPLLLCFLFDILCLFLWEPLVSVFPFLA